MRSCGTGMGCCGGCRRPKRGAGSGRIRGERGDGSLSGGNASLAGGYPTAMPPRRSDGVPFKRSDGRSGGVGGRWSHGSTGTLVAVARDRYGVLSSGNALRTCKTPSPAA
jgi:hypothetical protein